MRRESGTCTAAFVLVDVAALVALRPAPARLAADLAAPHAWFARDGVDGAVATLATSGIWVVAAWLAIGLLAAAAARLPGLAGACSAGLCRVVLPRVVRNVLAGSAGLGVLLAPVTSATALDHNAARAPGRAATTSARPVPSPTWPVGAPHSATVPAPRWPSRPQPPTAQPTTASSSRPAGITVRAGDSLWLITARRLGPRASAAEIAAQWPRWYAANRDVIGADPALLTPGQVLRAPPAITQEAHP